LHQYTKGSGTPLPVDQQQAYVTIGASTPVVLEMDPRTPDTVVVPDPGSKAK
jgi:hypothetical protein